MMNGMEGMGWGMWWFAIPVWILVLLGIAALVKYLFAGSK